MSLSASSALRSSLTRQLRSILPTSTAIAIFPNTHPNHRQTPRFIHFTHSTNTYVTSSSSPSPLSSASPSTVSAFSQLRLNQFSRRSYFWRAKNQEDEVVQNPKTTVTKEKVIPDEVPKDEKKPEEDLNLKATRLGFSTFTDGINRVLASWPHIKTYSVWVLVGTGMLFVFKAGLNLVDFFATINFLDVGEVAFIAGLVSGVGLVGCGWLGTRFLRLRPEPIFQHALKRLNTDSTVVQYMGRQITPSNFRAYSFVNGAVRMTEEQRERARIANATGIYKYWQPKRLQLFFQVTGSNGAIGMVSAEVEKSWRGDHSYNLLSVDLQTGERIILEGDVNYKIYQGVIKLR